MAELVAPRLKIARRSAPLEPSTPTTLAPTLVVLADTRRPEFTPSSPRAPPSSPPAVSTPTIGAPTPFCMTSAHKRRRSDE